MPGQKILRWASPPRVRQFMMVADSNVLRHGQEAIYSFHYAISETPSKPTADLMLAVLRIKALTQP